MPTHPARFAGQPLNNTNMNTLTDQTNSRQEDLSVFESMKKLFENDRQDDDFYLSCYRWITSLQLDDELSSVYDRLRDFRDNLLNDLSSPMLLPNCQLNEREMLERRMSFFISLIDSFLQGITDVQNHQVEEEVNSCLQTLRDTSYIYQPMNKFIRMLCYLMTDFETMEHLFPEIVNTLRRIDIRLSKRRPFRFLWIGLIEQYVRRIFDRPEKLTDRQTLEEMIQALALQLNLSEGSQHGLIDNVLNRSTLFRLSSKMDVEPEKLLDEALYNLVRNEQQSYMSYSVVSDDAIRTASFISFQAHHQLTANMPTARFESGNALLQIKDNQIVIMTADAAGKANLFLPINSLGLWHGMMVRLSEKPDASLRTRSNTIGYYKRLWRFIFQSLFEEQKKVVTRQKLMPDDEVGIIVKRQIPGTLTFECEVVDEGFEGYTGTLDALNDIVNYHPGFINVDTFRTDGKPMVLPAIVTIDEDGHYVFKMKDLIADFMDQYRIDHYNYNSRVYCRLNSAMTSIGRVPAISREGLSVSVGVDNKEDLALLKSGKIVECYNPQQGPKNYMNVTYLSDTQGMRFTVEQAFHNLMDLYRDEELYTAKEDEEATDEVMDRSHVFELMYIIEAYAGTEENYVKAYNYINFCKVLARMLDSNKEKFYDKQLMVLELLSDFDANNKFTSENLQLLNKEAESFVNVSDVLYERFRELQVVSWLETTEHNDELFKLSANRSNENLRQLASLVISYNFIKPEGLMKEASEILNKIRGLLNLKREGTDKKYYGREDNNTEFKTSVVYPEYNMHPDIQLQTKKILSEICAFLNRDGGTLYLGVNDQGYERGLEEDLKYALFKNSKDRYEDYIINQVVMQLSKEAGHYVQTSWDKDKKVKTEVLEIHVSPCPNPISLDGVYYERLCKTCQRVSEDYLPTFLENRKKWAAEHNLATAEEARQELERNLSTVSEEKPVSQPVPTVEKIETSAFRNNVLHNWEDGYEEGVAYLCFVGDDSYEMLDRDSDIDNCRLELIIHDSERGGWLVMQYADGSTAKVPVEELLERSPFRLFKRYNGSKLLFASIAGQDDVVVTGLVDGKDNKRLRLDELGQFEECSMQDEGTLPIDVEHFGVHISEVVPKDLLPDWATYNAKRTELGRPIKTQKGEEIMNMLLDAREQQTF